MKVYVSLKHQWHDIVFNVPAAKESKITRIVQDKLKAKEYREAVKKAGGEYKIRLER